MPKKKTRKITEITQDIKQLVQEPGFLYTLASLLRSDLFFPPEEFADVNWHEKISFQEFNFVVGLLIEKPIKMDITSPNDMKEQGEKLRKLLEELHRAFNNPAIEKLVGMATGKDSKPNEENFDSVFGSGEVMSEAIFYDESGAYDFQFFDLAPKRYEGDKEWLLKNVGIDIATCVAIAKTIRNICEDKANLLFKFEKEPHEVFLKMLIGSFCIFPEDLSEFPKEDIAAFFKLFSIKAGGVNKELNHPGDYNIIDSHPFIELEQDRYFLPVPFSLAQSIYESPFFWIKDADPYRDTFLNRRGSETEKQAQEFFVKVFGSENVHRDVKIYSKEDKLLTDIDLLVTKGNKAIIVQAKSKKLTRLSRKGDEQQIKKDFSGAIQSAYNQAITSRTAILLKDSKFIDNKGAEIQLEQSIDDAYIICLTTDIYPALAPQTRTFLKKNTGDSFPITLSIFDLDILTFYLNDPYELLYYLRQRIKFTDYFHVSSEISAIAYHLNKKIFPMEGYDHALIDHVWGQLIDANYPSAAGYREKTLSMERLHHTWKNDDFNQIIEQVKNTGDPHATDAVFFLYDLAGHGADDLVKQIKSMKNQSDQDGKHHDFSMLFDKHGVSYIIKPDSDHFKEEILYTTMAKKYKTKSDEWLGLATRVGSKRLVEVILYNKDPWQLDQRLENITPMLLPHGTAINPHSKLGRNDPCYCGSERKYKKCCLNKRSVW